MKCQKCGAEIPANSLYCLECGEDIHIVPDFEPEIEMNLEKALNSIVEEVFEEAKAPTHDLSPEEETPKTAPWAVGGKMFSLWIPLIIFGILLLIMGIIASLYFTRYHSFDYQVEKARKYVLEGQLDSAVDSYKRALEIDNNNIEIKFALLDVYFRKNNKIEYEYLLREIVADPNATFEQLESAYGKLIAIYKAREDYDTIGELLSGCENESILGRFQNYIAEPPQFSIEEGYYTTLQPLKLSSLASGTIYYTTDLSTPDENSNKYTAPILLDEGDHVIKACFVNDYGISSECVEKQYHVIVEDLPLPEISILSGEYDHPVDIEVLDAENSIYYTTDGSVPTEDSAMYTEPIPLPLGKSQFRFVRIADGKSSEVVDRDYKLVIDTDITVQDAEWTVIQYAMNTRRVLDAEGHIEGRDDDREMLKYQLQYVKNIRGLDDSFGNDYYVIAEVYYSADGSRNKTGTFYAVNIYSNRLYRLQINADNNYHLIEIE